MHKVKLTRRIAAATVSLALAAGIFAAAPLSADAAKARPAKSNWRYVAEADANGVSYTPIVAESYANGV